MIVHMFWLVIFPVRLQDSVQRQDLLFGSRPEEIMTRVGQISLIQRKVRCQANFPCRQLGQRLVP
jgi:hypothetical protein